MRKILLLSSIFLLTACSTSGVKKKEKQTENQDSYSFKENPEKAGFENAKEKLKQADAQKVPESNQKSYPNGIKITWFKHGKGNKISKRTVYKINYEVRLEDGTVVDGNQLLNREWLPYMTGFQMQTKGWEFALEQMKVGDFVEVYIPSDLARGEKGIKGLIPPNSPNVLKIEILGKIEPTKQTDGTWVWLLEENHTEKIKANLESSVEFHYMVSSESNPKYDISYRRNQPYNLQFSDFGIVKGLKKGLLGAKKADKIWILVPPSEAYGEKGLVNLVKPNEYLFYDIFVLNVQP